MFVGNKRINPACCRSGMNEIWYFAHPLFDQPSEPALPSRIPRCETGFIVSKYSLSEESVLAEAKQEHKKGNIEGAITLYQRLVSNNPGNKVFQPWLTSRSWKTLSPQECHSSTFFKPHGFQIATPNSNRQLANQAAPVGTCAEMTSQSYRS